MRRIDFLPEFGLAQPTNTANQNRRNGHDHVDFRGGVEQSWYHSKFMSEDYALGTCNFTLHYRMAAATAGSIRMDVAFERIGPTKDVDVDSFAAAKSIIDTVPTTSGVEKKATISFTNAEMGGIQPGDRFRLKLTMVQSDAVNHTAPGALQYVGSTLLEQ